MTGDDFMLIGLHKMAGERGDGLIPELLDMLRSGREALAAGIDLVQFPERPVATCTVVDPASNANNVIAFPVARRGATRPQ